MSLFSFLGYEPYVVASLAEVSSENSIQVDSIQTNQQ